MSFIRKHLFLVLSLLALLVGGLLLLATERGPLSPTETQYLATVQQRVLDELRQSDADLLMVQARFSATGNPGFGQLRTPTRYPYFVFRDGRLVFWSGHRFVPDYPALTGTSWPRTLTLSGSQFLANRRILRLRPVRVEVVALIPLRLIYPVENPPPGAGYNAALFGLAPKALRLTPGERPYNVYVTPNAGSEIFLFSIQTPDYERIGNRSLPSRVLVFWVLAVVLLGGYVGRWLWVWGRQRRYEAGLGLLAAYVVGVRALMLYYRVPFAFQETEVFNQAFYAAPVLAPSLGDLVLNLLVSVALLLYVTNFYFRSWWYRRLIAARPAVQAALSVAFVLGSFWMYQEMLEGLNRLYTHSGHLLDLKLSLDFYRQPLRLATLGVFVLLSAQYFLAVHVLVGLFIRLNPRRRQGLVRLMAGAALGAALWWLTTDLTPGLLALHGLYFMGLYLSRLPYSLYSFRYQTSIYFFTGAVVCALLGAYVVFQQEVNQDFRNKQRYGKELLGENDGSSERLFDQMNRQIRQDTLVGRWLLDPTLPRERVVQRIREAHLKNHLDHYDVAVSVFGPAGNPLGGGPDTTRLGSLAQRYRQPRYQTAYPGLFFVKEPDSLGTPAEPVTGSYVDFVPLTAPSQQAPALLNTLVLQLKRRDAIPQRGYSGLLAPAQVSQEAGYSQATFDARGRLLASSGSFHYEKYFPGAWLRDASLYHQGLQEAGYRHVGVVGKDGRRIVVSSPGTSFTRVYAGFSFLFLVLVLVVVGLIAGYAVRYGVSTRKVNFTARIQIFLHGAFLLPLLLVVGIAMGIIGRTLLDSQEKTYLDQTRNGSAAFASQLDAYAQGKISAEDLQREVKKLAVEVGRDVSVFNSLGWLLAPSQPEVYEKGLVSRFINPDAYVRLLEEHEREALLAESLGNLPYKMAYVALNSPHDGRLLGVLSVPFYESGAAFEKQVLDVMAFILNTFTTVFLVLLVLSYFASRALTVPLRLITQKIRRTNLDKLNEPLDWKSDDEIGLLIGEYNRMLVKLEDSKQALSQSEKQSAWREMAKQVAHEIKNPLTPMKLTLQQLQRILPADNPATKRLIDRAFNSLIDQIDNLSDIANSFSDFAKMPVPKNEVFDLVPVVQKTLDLYADDRSINLRASIRPRSAYVLGDPHLMSRILTNLIINAIQAVPATRKPDIRLNVNTGDEFVVLDVSDNGSGIPEPIRQKVFMPNFSTKDGGSGVGLAVAKRGVEHAHGSIWFETEEGRGTTFFISLPLADVKQAKPAGVVS